MKREVPAPACHSRFISTCCGMPAASPWRTKATTRARYKAYLGHEFRNGSKSEELSLSKCLPVYF
jgi:hypothetical protein